MNKNLLFLFSFLILSNLLQAQDKNAELLDATFEEKEREVFQLLKGGSDPNTTTADGVSPLMYAADKGNMYLCKILIQYGAEIDMQPSDGTSALHAATKANHTEIIQFLSEEGADPNIEDQNTRSPLHFACAYGYPMAADLLLYYGADPDKRDLLNRPIMITAFYGDTLMTELLLKYEADPNLKGYFNNTALMCAAQENHLPTVKLLVNSGADINKRNNQNMSALDIAVYYGHSDIVQFLLDKGAVQSKRIDEGVSTVEVAKIKGFTEIQAMLTKGKEKPGFTDGRFSVSLIQNTNFNDYLLGLETTFHQFAYNTELTLGWQNRPFRKKILLKESDHLYYQYREYISEFYLNAHKNFALTKKGYKEGGLYAGAGGAMYLYNYKGSQLKGNEFKALPQAGFYWYGRSAGLKVGYEYAPFSYKNNLPHRINLSLRVFINKQFHYTEKYMYY